MPTLCSQLTGIFFSKGCLHRLHLELPAPNTMLDLVQIFCTSLHHIRILQLLHLPAPPAPSTSLHHILHLLHLPAPPAPPCTTFCTPCTKSSIVSCTFCTTSLNR